MLVLSRKKNEQVVIDDDITITVLEIRGNLVRLGVEAPESVPVHRREVWIKLHPGATPGPGFVAPAEGAPQDPDGASDDPASDQQP